MGCFCRPWCGSPCRPFSEEDLDVKRHKFYLCIIQDLLVKGCVCQGGPGVFTKKGLAILL